MLVIIGSLDKMASFIAKFYEIDCVTAAGGSPVGRATAKKLENRAAGTRRPASLG